MTIDDLMAVDREDPSKAAKALKEEEIKQLIGGLMEKEDRIRYPSLLLLQSRSAVADDVYPYRETFREKLKSPDSYQRNIGLRLIAENARWDDGWLDGVISEYLSLLSDEKPVTVRQCIQYLNRIVPYKHDLVGSIADALMALDLTQVRETMRKLVLCDILEVLALIRKVKTSERIESYIMDAMTGGILDKKTIKRLEEVLSGTVRR